MSEATYIQLLTFATGVAAGCLLVIWNVPDAAGFFFVWFLLASTAFFGLGRWWNRWRKTPARKAE